MVTAVPIGATCHDVRGIGASLIKHHAESRWIELFAHKVAQVLESSPHIINSNCHPAMEERNIDVIERFAGRNEINVFTRVAILEVTQRNRPATRYGSIGYTTFSCKMQVVYLKMKAYAATNQPLQHGDTAI